MTRPLLTYSDVVDALKEFASSQGKQPTLPVYRRAIIDAYTEIISAHRWSSLQRTGRVVVYPRYTTGTVVYEHTGGANERQVTLTTGTWPEHAADMSIRFGSNYYACDINQRISDTVVTLDATMNPGADVASTTYTLYHRFIRLPEDFLSFTGPFAESVWRLGVEITAAEMMGLDKYTTTSGDIIYYAIGECPDVHDRKALFIYPQMESQRVVDFVYRRRARELRYSGHASAESVGTIVATASSAAIVGTSTTFSSGMAGSILRIGTDATNQPTGRYGDYPFAEERSILSYTDATHVTLDAAVSASHDGVKYQITDIIDLPRIAHPAFMRFCERELAISLNLEGTAKYRDRADRSLLAAMGADNSTEWDPTQSLPHPVAIPEGNTEFD